MFAHDSLVHVVPEELELLRAKLVAAHGTLADAFHAFMAPKPGTGAIACKRHLACNHRGRQRHASCQHCALLPRGCLCPKRNTSAGWGVGA